MELFATICAGVGFVVIFIITAVLGALLGGAVGAGICKLFDCIHDWKFVRRVWYHYDNGKMDKNLHNVDEQGKQEKNIDT